MQRKASYIIARIAGLVTVSVLALLYAVQTPAVQTRLSSRAIDSITETLDGKVSYGTLKLMPSGALLMTDILITDGSPCTEDARGRAVVPADTVLIDGGSEERRRLMDVVISQYDVTYIDALNRYNKALQQRNSLLRVEAEPDADLMALLEEQMAVHGEVVSGKRAAFVDELVPLFQDFYGRISQGKESVSLAYQSHCQRGPLLDVIRRDRFKDRAVGYSLHGIHRDDLEMLIGGYPIRREGSQGQHKTYVISLKLAQFEFLKRIRGNVRPILLLDDIFDKLDAGRVEQIVRIVGGEGFGQIFMTDTNREHLDQILRGSALDYKLFWVEKGEIKQWEGSDVQA